MPFFSLYKKPSHWIVVLMFLAHYPVFAQVANPYHINGNARQDNCNCYTLTPDAFTQSGSVWNIYKIDLTQPFHFNFSVNLGSRDQDGADGIVFILQPVSTSLGSTGEGMGFAGITPSIGIAIDTWLNTNLNDPDYDHISIHRDGDLNHSSSNNLAGPVTALAGSNNIEDGLWHLLGITWDPGTKILSASMDNKERVSVKIDLVKDVFNNDPLVFWGFTAATGGARNLQRFCTALNPGFTIPADQQTCFGTPIQFIDSSTSFGSIVKWFWDFGDGTTDTVRNPPPKIYASPGRYEARLNILGNDGCLSDTFRKEILVGSDPLAGFSHSPPLACQGQPVQFLDASTVEYGTINRWEWNIGGNPYTDKNPVVDAGLGNVLAATLRVGTREGCISSLHTGLVPLAPAPQIDFTAQLACTGNPVVLEALNLSPSVTIQKWTWDLGDGRIDSSGVRLEVLYDKGGTYTVGLDALGSNGCPAITIAKPVTVYETDAFAGNDTIIALGQPLQLNASGGEIYNWTPSTGLSATDIPNPVATLSSDISYILTAASPVGCATRDTINIRVYQGPEIYVPTAFTPNHDGLNDILKVLPVGVTLEYFKIFDRWGNLVFSTGDYRRGWDGTIKGNNPATGVYVWLVKGKDFLGNTVTKRGSTTLIR